MEEKNKKDYTEVNLLRIGQQLEILNDRLENINRNLGLIADPEFKRKYEEYIKNSKIK